MKPQNPNAFPIALVNNSNPHHKDAKGMTLRDYFAAKVINAIISAESWEGRDVKLESGKSIIENMATYSYNVADAMLKTREENG